MTPSEPKKHSASPVGGATSGAHDWESSSAPTVPEQTYDREAVSVEALANPYRSPAAREDSSPQSPFFLTAVLVFFGLELAFAALSLMAGLGLRNTITMAAVCSMATGPVAIVVAGLLAERESRNGP